MANYSVRREEIGENSFKARSSVNTKWTKPKWSRPGHRILIIAPLLSAHSRRVTEHIVATGEQLKALLKSHLAGDDDLFRSVALQIAAHEATKGNERLAVDLRELVDKLKRVQQPAGSPKAVPIARASGELAGLVTASYPGTRLCDMVLAEDIHLHIANIIHEHRQRDLLSSHGLLPKRKLLLVGPPGCGKTMTAAVLANECELPLLAVQLHSLITKYMGETAAKLHLLFDAMHQTKGVYLFDEFDAIGATRSAGNDVGEIRRILNSFLLFLEKDESESIIVAATNFSGMLDDALFRRFDDVIEYGLPDATSIRKLIESRLSIFDVSQVNWPTIEKVAKGLSHAEVGRVCDDVARATVLAGSRVIDGESIKVAMRRRTGMRAGIRKKKRSDGRSSPPANRRH
jgi:SpoVK/Ycf46/Vps4 family AAA+-type ATPase